MSSEKRSQAARANGARSRGPVSPEGKAISARNAMRHGLLAKILLLPDENKTTFQALFYMLVDRFSPVDDIEMAAIEEMAACHWRLRRAISMETAIMTEGMLQLPDAAGDPSTAIFCDPGNYQKFELLGRYQTRLQNMYNRALRGLANVRKFPPRTGPPVTPPVEPEPILPVPNEPKDPNVCNTELPAPTPIRPAQPVAEAPVEPTDPFVIQLTSPDLEFVPFNPDIFR
jgi:hypothetical protein